MAGISSQALTCISENKYKYNGIEQNTDFDLNMYGAFYRNLDPQIGRFWQLDPDTQFLTSTTPYESMGNDPVNYQDPLGDFRYKFGAWLHKIFNGGGEIGQNNFGEWFVRKTEASFSEEGGVTVTAKVTYGADRQKNSALKEDLADDMRIATDIYIHGENSMYKMYNSKEDAFRASVGFLGLTVPHPTLRISTNAANASQLAKQGQKILEKVNKTLSVQKQARHVAGTSNSGGFLNSVSDAAKVLDAAHTGEAVFLGTTNSGNPVFRYSGVTGTNVNLGAGVTGQPTNIFMIKGTVSPSVVPISPAWIQ
jgi:RHS repeat-associated protein